MKRSKLYTRREPSLEGKLYFIFCEGEKRETNYFHFFNELASQVIVQLVELEDGNNSPLGLLNNAKKKLVKDEINETPEFDINEIDEVWFIIDTDKWDGQIAALREEVSKFKNWYVAQSNPSFEVWLYYHFFDTKPTENIENWKDFVNQKVTGGFDSRKHPIYIETANLNSENNFSMSNGEPEVGTSEVHELGKKVHLLVKEEIDDIINTP